VLKFTVLEELELSINPTLGAKAVKSISVPVRIPPEVLHTAAMVCRPALNSSVLA
jgi:hypothetical protein